MKYDIYIWICGYMQHVETVDTMRETVDRIKELRKQGYKQMFEVVATTELSFTA